MSLSADYYLIVSTVITRDIEAFLEWTYQLLFAPLTIVTDRLDGSLHRFTSDACEIIQSMYNLVGSPYIVFHWFQIHHTSAGTHNMPI